MNAAATTATPTAKITAFSGFTGETQNGGRYAAYGEFFGDAGTITIDGIPLTVEVWKDHVIKGPMAFESFPPGPAEVKVNDSPAFETTITA